MFLCVFVVDFYTFSSLFYNFLLLFVHVTVFSSWWTFIETLQFVVFLIKIHVLPFIISYTYFLYLLLWSLWFLFLFFSLSPIIAKFWVSQQPSHIPFVVILTTKLFMVISNILAEHHKVIITAFASTRGCTYLYSNITPTTSVHTSTSCMFWTLYILLLVHKYLFSSIRQPWHRHQRWGLSGGN